MLPPTPKISLISRATGSRFEDSTRLVLATSKRVLVESLRGVFSDFGYLPHIEESSDMLDMKRYLSDIECPALYQLPLYYGYVLHFKAPDDADRALAIFNLRAVPGSAPPIPMFLFKHGSFNVGAAARRIHPIPSQWNDAAMFTLTRMCGSVRFAYVHPVHGGIVHFESEEEAKATENAMKAKIGQQTFHPMVDTTVSLSVSWSTKCPALGSFSYSKSGVKLTLNLPVKQDAPRFSIVGTLQMIWITFLFLVVESTRRLESIARRAAEICRLQFSHRDVSSKSEVMNAIAKLHNTVRDAQSKSNIMKHLHSAEIEKGVLQLQLLTAKSDFEDFKAKIRAILKEGEVQEALTKASLLTKGFVDFAGPNTDLPVEKETSVNQDQGAREDKKLVESVRTLVTKLAASKRENEALLGERTYVWKNLIELKTENASLHNQNEEYAAKTSKLQKALDEAELYGEEMWQWGECWSEQFKVAQEQCKVLEAEEKIRSDQRIWEDERDERLRVIIEETFGSLEKASSWDDFMAFEHVETLLVAFEKGRYIHRDDIPLTMRAVPWPVADDPRWFFRLSDIRKEKVESFLVKYHNLVAKGDDVLYTRFLYMIRLIFDKDMWNPAQSLAGITNPKGFMDAGSTVFEVVEAEIERLESRMSAYNPTSSSIYF